MVLTQANPWPKLPGQTGLLALLEVSSALLPLRLSTTGLVSQFQVFCQPFVEMGWAVTVYRGWGRPGSGAWVPWSDCATFLVLQMSKAAAWDYYLGTADRNTDCQDPRAGCCKPLLSYPWIVFSFSFRGNEGGMNCHHLGDTILYDCILRLSSGVETSCSFKVNLISKYGRVTWSQI